MFDGKSAEIEQPVDLPPTFTWAGDRFLRIAFGDRLSDTTGRRVRAVCESLLAANIAGLRDLTPAYTTVVITFDARAITGATEQAVVNAIGSSSPTAASAPTRLIEVPVCYDTAHGEDLQDLARTHNLTTDEVAAIHSAAEYTVAFIGFTPGFPYLTGLSEKLSTPRLPSPRPRIPAGSIGIAGTQTGIYPGGTPGGWRLIGRTPLSIFDANREKPALLAMGDCVRFVPITLEQFDKLSTHLEEH